VPPSSEVTGGREGTERMKVRSSTPLVFRPLPRTRIPVGGDGSSSIA